MKQPKLVAVIIIIAGLLMYFVAWQLYDELALWQQFSQTEYQNYVVMGILGFYATAGIAGYKLTQPKEQEQPPRKQTHHGNPTPNVTTDIDKLTVKIAFLEERMKQAETTIKGLQVFFKPKEEKPSA